MRGLYGRGGRSSIPSLGIERPRVRRTLPAMFTVHTTQSAPAGSRDALAALERNIGFIPNLAATIAGSPIALQGFVAMQTALRGTRLSALEREVVGISVSRVNAQRVLARRPLEVRRRSRAAPRNSSPRCGRGSRSATSASSRLRAFTEACWARAAARLRTGSTPRRRSR